MANRHLDGILNPQKINKSQKSCSWEEENDQDTTETLLDSSGKAAGTKPERKRQFSIVYHKGYIPSFPKGVYGVFVLFQSPIILVAMGVFSCIVAYVVDYCILIGMDYREYFGNRNLLELVVFSVVLAMISVISTGLICPLATGSGLPEMKVAISGVAMKEYLTLRCLLAKMVGLIFAYTAGLSIGKEGPLILITCAFTQFLLERNAFERIKEHSAKRLEMLACACAAAVAATFGTPFGGVLFSVEVTSNFYMVRNLPRSFFAAIVGATVIALSGSATRLYLFHSSVYELSKQHPSLNVTVDEILIFTVLGVGCGLLGACFIRLITVLVQYRKEFVQVEQEGQLLRKAILVVIVTIATITIEYFAGRTWFYQNGSALLNNLFTPGITSEDETLFYHLLVYFPVKFILTACCVVLPIPAGLFAPTFIIGGLLGRLVGVYVRIHFPLMSRFLPFEFAIVGAAAFSSGVTRAISTAVIVLELGNRPSLSVPVSVAILAAYFTGGRFNENVYDVLITTKQFPRLKKLHKAAYDIPAWEVMCEVNRTNVLQVACTFADAEYILRSTKVTCFPIVDSYKSMILLGLVTRDRLQNALNHYQNYLMHANSEPSHNASTNTIEFIVWQAGKYMRWVRWLSNDV